jgi:Fur family transcriptional regulator, stress-responsive regulator
VSLLLQRLRDRGWRITPQRRAVAEVLLGENVHLTAEQVFDSARRIVPEISLATVYNTLNELVAMNEVTEVVASGGPVRYDSNVERPHQHLTCLSCGELLDVYPAGERVLALEEDYGYSIVGIAITFQGYCPDCAAVVGER